VIVLNGDNSSPSVPVGTGGPKSRSKTAMVRWGWVSVKITVVVGMAILEYGNEKDRTGQGEWVQVPVPYTL